MKIKSSLTKSLTKFLALSLGLTIAAQATDYYWNTTTTGLWSTGANWSDNANPVGTNFAEFLALTNPLDGGSFLAPQIDTNAGNVSFSFSVPANRSALVETSLDLTTWWTWDVPGNAGLPLPGGSATIVGPMLGPKQFFRLRLQEN